MAKEKKEEIALSEFKAKKRADSKRKDEELKQEKEVFKPGGGSWNNGREGRAHTYRREGKTENTETKDGIRISNLMDNRREEDILQGIHTLCKNEKEESPARRKTRTYQVVPTGWKECGLGWQQRQMLNLQDQD